MTVPAAPTEANGDKIHFIVDDNAGTTRANLMRGYKRTTINGDSVAELGVYPTSGTLENGGQTLAGSTAEQITTTSTPCQGVLVKAAPTNAGAIYVGKSDVTTDYADTTGGFPLEPGESVGVPCRNANEVYIRGTTGDKVAWIASAD
jgi:hypothetical protein